MGVDTKLQISSKHEIRDIVTVLETHLNLVEKTERKRNHLTKKYNITKYKVKVEPVESSGCSGFFHLFFQIDGHEERMMSLFVNQNSPIGPTTHMSLGHNEEAVMIMRTIAEVFGGILMANDCSCEEEVIEGQFTENDGLPYFIKYALLHNEMSSVQDIKGLLKSIRKWEVEMYDSGRQTSCHNRLITGELATFVDKL
jgi:hypothetical protein